MTLRARAFEKRLGKLLRGAIKGLPRRDRPKGRRIGGQGAEAFIGVLLIGVIGGGALGALHQSTGMAEVYVALWSILWSLVAANKWQMIEQKGYLAVWHCMPIQPAELHRAFTREAAPYLLLWPLFVFALYGGVVVSSESIKVGKWLLLSIGQGAVIAVTGIHLAAFLKLTRFRLAIATGALAIGLLALYPPARAVIVREAPAINAVLPAGWVAHLLGANSWREWMFALPLAVLFAAVPASLGRIRKRFAELDIWRVEETDEVDEVEAMHAEIVEQIMQPRGPTEIEDDLLTRGLAAAPLGERDRIEAFVFGKFSERQRKAADFLWPFVLGWTRQWKWAARLLLIIVVLAAAARPLLASDWLVAALIYIVAWLLPLGAVAGGGSPIFRKYYAPGGFAPFYSVFPVSYDDLYSTMLKANFWRLLAWAPMFVLFAGVIGYLAENSFLLGTLAGMRMVALSFVAQPVWVGSRIHTGSTMVREISVLALIPLGFGGLVLSVAGLVMPMKLQFVVATFAAVAVISKLIQLTLRAVYRGRSLDLMERPKGGR